MSQAYVPFRPAQIASPPQLGGRAAVCWRTSVARSVARAEDLWRSCAWVKALMEPCPRLREGRLLGNCLPALAADVTRAAEPERRVARPLRKTSPTPSGVTSCDPRTVEDKKPSAPRLGMDCPPGIPPTKRRPRGSPNATVKCQPPADVAVLPQEASRTLLCRIVEAQQPAHAEYRSSCDRPGPKSERRERKPGILQEAEAACPASTAKAGLRETDRRQRRRRQLAETRLFSPTYKPSAQCEWKEDLTTRARRALLNSRLCPVTDASRRENRPSSSDFTSVLAREWKSLSLEGEAVLAGQWSTPVSGPRASRELLMRMAELLQDDNSPGASDQTRSKPSRSNRGQRQLAVGVEVQEVPAAGGGAPEPSGAASRTKRLVKDASGQSGSVIRGPLEFERELDLEDLMAQSPLAPMLLPLVRHRIVEIPAPAVATMSAAREAPNEAATPEEDLDLLASKIDRILQEEARRHGIDV